MQLRGDHLSSVRSSKEILVLQHAESEDPGTLKDFFEGAGWGVRILHMGAVPLRLLNLLNAGVVVSMGGPMNVYETDKYPFLKEEEEFLHNALQKKIPVLGICLGAQILAKVCGAKVEKATQKELGWYNIALTEEGAKDPLFGGIASPFSAFQWHEDTFAVPAGGTLLATGKPCCNQAFRFGPNAYGLQFHIEVTTPTIESWVREPMARGDKSFNYDTILRFSREYEGDVKIMAFELYRNLTHIIVKAHS